MENITLLENESIRMWLKKACHSIYTEKTYLSAIKKYFEFTNLTPDKIIEEWQRVKYNWEEAQKFIDKHSELIEKFYCLALDNYKPKSKENFLASIVSFYRHNKIPISVDCKERAYVVYHNRPIQKTDIQRILEHASLRDRTFFLLMLESGLRPNTIVQLRYRNIKRDFEANKVPMMIEVEPEISKWKDEKRFTFIGEDGFKALKEYLAPRMPLRDDDFLFEAVHKHQQKGQHPTPSLFSVQFARIVRKLNLAEKIREDNPRRKLNLYTLRKYFRNNIKVSDPAYREFWMGHSLKIDNSYFEKNIEHPETIEKHRQEYMKGYDSLRVYEPKENSKMQDLEVKLNEAYQSIGKLQQKLQQSITIPEMMELFKGTLPMDIYQKLEEKLKAKTTSSKISEYV